VAALVVGGAAIACAIAGGASVAAWVGIVVSCVLVDLNVTHLNYCGPSLGMIPVSIFAMAPSVAAVASVAVGMSRIVLTAAAIVLFAIVAAFLICFALMRWHAHHPKCVLSREPIVVVLGNADAKQNPSPVLCRRLDLAYEVWHANPDVRLVLSGGHTFSEDVAECDVMADYLAKRGVPRDRLVLEGESLSTPENIANVIPIVRELASSDPDLGPDAAKRLVVITSTCHEYRVWRECRRNGVELVPAPVGVPRERVLQDWSREVVLLAICSSRG
jgi:uncharacterized SAM-binding protein YcdF (DUF218 family)